MTRSTEERSNLERLNRFHSRGGCARLRDIERRVCGCDYGGTSWTTRAEAEATAARLGLAPGRRLLEVGAGSGWPALYWARTTGCNATLVDLPREGLRMALARAADDGSANRVRAVVAAGEALPFAAGRFDAINHSDVLCCLVPKQAVLAACRHVIREMGVMVFTVIAVAAGLDAHDRTRAEALGPPFVGSDLDYPSLLALTGWRLVETLDLTADYAAALERQLEQDRSHAEELAEILGPNDAADRQARHERAAEGLAAGLLQRTLYHCAPLPTA